MNKNIILHSDSLIMGGAERLALVYAEIFSSGNNHVELIINENNGEYGNVILEEIPQNIIYKFMSSEKVMNKINKYRRSKTKSIFFRGLYSIFLKKRKIEVEREMYKVFKNSSYDIQVDFFCKIPIKLTNNRTITWLHMTPSVIKDKKKKWYEEKFEKTGKIVVISEDMKNEFIKKFPKYRDKLVRIYNPFDFNYIRKKAEEIEKLSDREMELIKEPYIVSCCRLDEKQKDVSTLIKAFKNLKIENKIEEKLYIIGDGPDRNKLERFVLEEKMGKEIVFLGLQKNPYVWMKNSKLFVHSSKKEGFGMVLVEAIILDKVVVSSDCPVGPREILKDGEAGYLVPVGNVDKMQESIFNALSNNEVNIKKLEYAKNRINEFSLDEIEKQLNMILKEV
jgi:glycosyltransferase involved in cell wall biosynthesis